MSSPVKSGGVRSSSTTDEDRGRSRLVLTATDGLSRIIPPGARAVWGIWWPARDRWRFASSPREDLWCLNIPFQVGERVRVDGEHLEGALADTDSMRDQEVDEFVAVDECDRGRPAGEGRLFGPS